MLQFFKFTAAEGVLFKTTFRYVRFNSEANFLAKLLLRHAINFEERLIQLF